MGYPPGTRYRLQAYRRHEQRKRIYTFWWATEVVGDIWHWSMRKTDAGDFDEATMQRFRREFHHVYIKVRPFMPAE